MNGFYWYSSFTDVYSANVLQTSKPKIVTMRTLNDEFDVHLRATRDQGFATVFVINTASSGRE